MSEPPYDLDAEVSVLGAMLFGEPVASRTIKEGLRREDFYRDQHRAVFDAVAELTAREKPVDPISVSDALGNQLRKAGGRDYVHSLATRCPAPANALHYAQIVKDKAIMRLVQQAAQGLSANPDLNGKASEAVAKIEQALQRRSGHLRELREDSFGDVMGWDIPPTRWVVQDLVPPGVITFIHGLPETFKTFIGLNIAIEIAKAKHYGEAQKLFDRLDVCEGHNVGYVWQDDSREEEARRIQQVARGELEDADLPIWFLLNQGLRLDNGEDLATLARWTEDRQLGVVMLDSLQNFVGDGSTKDDTWTTPFINRLKAVADDTGSAFVAIHHDSKPNADTAGRGAGQTMHGSVMLEAGARSGLHCRRPDDTLAEVEVKRWGNSGKHWGPFRLVLDQESLTFELQDVSSGQKSAPEADVYFVVKKEFEGDASRQDVIDHFADTASDRMIKNRLNALVGAHRLHRYKEGKITRFTTSVPDRFGEYPGDE